MSDAAPARLRLPPEWEPQAAVWLTRPHAPDTWPGVLDAAVDQWQAFADSLAEGVSVRVTQDQGIATDDAWCRDYGPLFVQKGRGARDEGRENDDNRTRTGSQVPSPLAPHPSPLSAVNFRFNAWGGKYEPHGCDAAAGRLMAEAAGVPAERIVEPGPILEGGAIDVDGRGTLLTTEQCLLNPNRNPRLTRDDYAALFADTLGVDRILWLPGGIEGDDTDGHVDDVARFIAPHTVACVVAHRDHPDYEVTRRNADTLRRGRAADDKPLTVVELPAPEPRAFDYPADRFGPGGRSTVPASYANFVICNGRVFVPVFGQPADDRALRALDEAMPDHAVVPVRADVLVVGLGTLHCLSMHQPLG